MTTKSQAVLNCLIFEFCQLDFPVSSASARGKSVLVFSHKTVVEDYLIILFHVSLEVVGIEISGCFLGAKQPKIGEQVVTFFNIPFDDAYQIMFLCHNAF